MESGFGGGKLKARERGLKRLKGERLAEGRDMWYIVLCNAIARYGLTSGHLPSAARAVQSRGSDDWRSWNAA
jgi:hypothetical protein